MRTDAGDIQTDGPQSIDAPTLIVRVVSAKHTNRFTLFKPAVFRPHSGPFSPPMSLDKEKDGDKSKLKHGAVRECKLRRPYAKQI